MLHWHQSALLRVHSQWRLLICCLLYCCHPCRLKQSTLPPPNSRLLQPGPTSLKLGGGGTTAVTPPPSRLQERLASLQQQQQLPAPSTPASAYRTPLSQLASSGGVRGTGGGRLHSFLQL